MQFIPGSPTRRPDEIDAGGIGFVAVPAARLEVWETAALDGGWLYGVEAQGANGATAFSGMLWQQSRLRDDQIAPVAGPTDAGRLLDVSPLTHVREFSRLAPIAELALLKLAMVAERPPTGSGIRFYISSFQAGNAQRAPSDILIKRSLASFQPGEETFHRTAVDAQFAFNDWQETIAFACRHPRLIWLEDPTPPAKWSSTIACPVPLSTGELAASIADVETILRYSDSTPLILHLELSRLGPIMLAASIDLARQKNVPFALHGHLPLDTILVLLRLGVEGLVELNLNHFSERAPWPYASRWIDSSSIFTGGDINPGLISQALEASVPDEAVRRT